MNRVLLVFFAVFAFAARSDGTLRCYMCDSHTDSSCEDPRKDGNLPAVECNSTTMTKWLKDLARVSDFGHLAALFDVDQPQHFTHLPDVACAKMNLKVGTRNVTLRSCQSAKTETVDTCATIRKKLSVPSTNAISMSYCDLCYSDACNGATNFAPPEVLQLLLGSIALMVFQAFRHSFA